MKLSFKDYCIKYHKEEMISQWDYDTNKQSPSEVPSSSKIPVAWKCEKVIAGPCLQRGGPDVKTRTVLIVPAGGHHPNII